MPKNRSMPKNNWTSSASGRWKAGDIRRDVSNKIPAQKGQQRDHLVEAQTIAYAANRVGASKHTIKDLQSVVNHKDNLQAKSASKNREAGHHVRKAEMTGWAQPKSVINKQMKGIANIERNWDLSDGTKTVINEAKKDLRAQWKAVERRKTH